MALTWRPTKIMNMRDLSMDDDFLSHLLVEKLGSGDVPLLVHKMDPSRKLPKTDAQDLLHIVRRLVAAKSPVQHATRQAVDHLLSLPPIHYYLRNYSQKQINAFATHASRYFELYHPSGCIEIAHTSRYAHRTGKSELCILATRYLTPGTVISELKGSMANLTDEEDKELKRTDLRNSDMIRRDFSVIHSKQMKKNHLFLGPARFVNHDCDNNCELFREGKYITFRVLRPINIGEEITAHYGDGYFGRKNRHCLCETCEKLGRGGYGPDYPEEEDDDPSGSDANSHTDSDSDTSSSSTSTAKLNINERRTRRGVYAIVQQEEDDSDDSEEENEKTLPNNLMTPDPEPQSCSPATLSPTPFRSIISTRRQKAQALQAAASGTQQLVTPPLSEDTASVAESASTTIKVKANSVSASATPTPTKVDKGKGKGKAVKEDDARVLRTRPSLADVVKPVILIPRGADGNPLPTCGTCGNVLPLISIEDKIVWGLGLEGSPRKKKIKHDCPRCLRHFAIYGHPWPHRRPTNGLPATALPTPRECTPMDSHAATRKLTHKALPVLDRKLAAAAFVSGKAEKHARERDNASEERPAKRRKVGVEEKVKDKGRRAVKVEMSVKARKELALEVRKRGRPGLSVGRRGKIYTYARVRRHSTGNVPEDRVESESHVPAPSLKRKRGRPRLSESRMEDVVKVEVDDRKAVLSSPSGGKADQPRESNGRFGKKSREREARAAARKAGIMRRQRRPKVLTKSPLSRAERAMEREKVRKWLEEKAKQSRSGEDGDGDEGPRKVEGERADPTADMEGSMSLVAQRKQQRDGQSISFRGGRLFSKPTPHAFARRPLWSLPSDPESSADEGGPCTPEDNGTPPVVAIVDAGGGVDGDVGKLVPGAPPALGALTYKPSPFNFARRRWASVSASPLDDGEEGSEAGDAKPNAPERDGGAEGLGVSRGGEEAIDSYVSYEVCTPVFRSSLASQSPSPRTLRRMRWSGGVGAGAEPVKLVAVREDHDLDLEPHEHECSKPASSSGIGLGLRHAYPTFVPKNGNFGTLSKSMLSFADIVSVPTHLVKAGWDSCSEVSDCS